MDRNSLSALLDGELDELATARLLREFEQSPELLDEWETFSLIGDALRERDHLGMAGRLGASRAMEIIRTEPAPTRGIRARFSAPRKLVPWALAASVALIAFTLAGGPSSAPLADSAGSQVREAAQRVLGGSGLAVADAREADPSEMDRYIDLHRDVASTGLQRASFDMMDTAGGVRGQ